MFVSSVTGAGRELDSTNQKISIANSGLKEMSIKINKTKTLLILNQIDFKRWRQFGNSIWLAIQIKTLKGGDRKKWVRYLMKI